MHHVMAVADLGHKVLQAVTAQQQPDVATCRECLSTTFTVPALKLTIPKEPVPPS